MAFTRGMSVGMRAALAMLLLIPMVLGTPLVTGNVATNELIEPPVQEDLDLAYCRSGSACGYLQVNAYGVNARQFCRCPRREGTCSLHWDPQDGHSVTMGSDQYKFCGSPPSIHVCNRDETAYTAAYIFNKATFMMAGEHHRIHCYCPPPMAHLQDDMVEDVVDGELIMATVHVCSMLPLCAEDAPCKEVSLGGGASLVNPKCRCPRNLSCPTFGLSVTPHSNAYPEGKAYSVHCQKPY
ncbi:U-scoloptoxin(11)-Sm5a-like [Macrobrachium nipponense]|uniref:U-scoloptoxin(11)-Sm5a-like n=1 Tax=Macrobrachium nipponense TaxID=159736 RepID=UPI0030C7F8AC